MKKADGRISEEKYFGLPKTKTVEDRHHQQSKKKGSPTVYATLELGFEQIPTPKYWILDGVGAGGVSPPPRPLASRNVGFEIGEPSPLATSLAVCFTFSENQTLQGADESRM